MKRPAARLQTQQLSLALEFETAPVAAIIAAPATSPPGGSSKTPFGLRRVVLGGQWCHFRLRRSRRRSIGFQIDDDGLTVSAPRWVALRDIDAAIVEKERWIRAKFIEWKAWRARRLLPQVVFVDGGVVPFLGADLVLRLGHCSETRLAATSAARELLIALPANASASQIRDAVQAWLQSEARRILGARLAHLSYGADVKPKRWALSSARSQWGSCTHDGRIRLNWRLVHFALPVIDYVVAHELAHLKELNHGPRFWSAVARLLPGFEAARNEIKDVDMDSLPA